MSFQSPHEQFVDADIKSQFEQVFKSQYKQVFGSQYEQVFKPTSQSLCEQIFELSTLTFNVSGVNLNPFEFWSDMNDPEYVSFMVAFEQAVNNMDDDTLTREIFTPKMFDELESEMNKLRWVGVSETRHVYESDLGKRTIISGFLKDKLLGEKRLVSFPDRYTNTINVNGEPPACRPTPINQCVANFTNLDEWFCEWKRFMFSAKLDNEKNPCDLLEIIKSNKYPAITDEEERISLPLQTLCLAVFDAILVYLADSTRIDWRRIKTNLLDTLVRNKVPRLVNILSKTYADFDVMFLQECSETFIGALRESPLGHTHTVTSHMSDTNSRNQASVVVTKNSTFTNVCDVTDLMQCSSEIAEGDLVSVLATHKNGRQLMLCSFHGDSEGRHTIPVLRDVDRLTCSLSTGLVFGLDANTTDNTLNEFQEVVFWCNLVNSWKTEPLATTYNARTSLQPQFHKAVKLENLHNKSSKNPKDHIIGTFHAVNPCMRDNTGNKEFVDQPFPSSVFPSDHAIVYGNVFMI